MIGQKVRFYDPQNTLGSNITEHVGVVEKYMPGGSQAKDLFNQPMCVIEGLNYWIPVSFCHQITPSTEEKV